MSPAALRRRARGGASRFGGALLLAVTTALLLACSDSEEVGDAAPRESASRSAAEIAREKDPRPSVLLVVIESLRTDAVASYGPDRASPLPRGDRAPTPNLDALAEKGLRYSWAIAASPDTVTSHTSIFTGLSAVEHAAGIWPDPPPASEIETLAERLSRAGYETAGFSENPMAGSDFGLDRGFERFVSPEPERVAARLVEGHSANREFDVVGRVRRWLKSRDASRPYFLFVNLSDPHLPYSAREENPYLPNGLSATRLGSVLALHPHNTKICRKLPDPETLEILASLYLDEVESADRKLGRLLSALRPAASRDDTSEPPRAPNADSPRAGRGPVVVVTSDHGAHFGEQRLLGHHFSVDNRVLRVPLIIDPGSTPSVDVPRVIETPVAQRRLADSVRCWSGEEDRCAAGLPTQDMPSADPVVSIAGNAIGLRPPAAVVDTRSLSGQTDYANALCAADSGLRGRNIAYFKGSMKYVWRESGPDQLFDLSWDPFERSDQIARGSEAGAALRSEVEAFIEANRLDRVHRNPLTGSLRSRAEAAYTAARKALVTGGKTATDAVWFAQLANRLRPDPRLENWILSQIPLHEQDPFYPIIVPEARGPVDVPEELGRGLLRFTQYLMSSVAGPEDRAMRFLETFLDMQTTDYILTHQLTALEWARAKGRPLSANAKRRGSAILAAIAQEHAADPVFRDLWVERAAFLTFFGEASEEQVEQWTRVIVEHHLGEGDWGHTGSELSFDGQTMVAEHPREHIRGMAMIVLARYLAMTEASAAEVP